jgi:hypothetical protein
MTMDSILTIVTPRTDGGLLVTLDELKAELNISSTEDDDYLTALLLRVSQALEQHCGRTFAVETVSEQFRSDGRCWPEAIALRRFPVTAIQSLSVDGLALDDVYDYEVDGEEGRLHRLDDDRRIGWSGEKIVAVYSAGYETTPGPVRQAAFELVKFHQAARTRDPALRSENILSGLYSYTLFQSSGDTVDAVLGGVAGLSDFIVRRMVW